jgi:hypothetical protein
MNKIEEIIAKIEMMEANLEWLRNGIGRAVRRAFQETIFKEAGQ